MAVHIHVTWGMNNSYVCDRSSETSSRVIDTINNNNKLTYYEMNDISVKGLEN
jgi:hypothetical protein